MGRLCTWWRCRTGNWHATVAEVYARSMWSYGRRLAQLSGTGGKPVAGKRAYGPVRGLTGSRESKCVLFWLRPPG